MTMRHLPIVVFLALLLTACSLERLPGVYRIDVQQGNVVTPAMVKELRPGMSRDQVRFIMGTPMVDNTFQPSRWDYYFSMKPGGGGDRLDYHLALHFEDDRLARIDGELPPEVRDKADTGGMRTVAVTGPVPDSRGILDRAWDAMTDWEFNGDAQPAKQDDDAGTRIE
ncbi:MAG: outer membrane protein assembly factor BamE [Gammaproteobacteria bacterium]|nr:outer membrane protein assembly factor BamE [Gammaproteobacteria bacterium]